MNKLISKIVGVALGLSLAAGTGVAVAANNGKMSVANAVSSPILTFDFEDSTAHRASGNNSYTATGNTYEENSVDIALTYADSVTSGTPLNGSANVLARVAKNSTNSPTIIVGPMDLSSYNVTGFSYYAKSVGTLTLTASYSTNGTNWTQGETHNGGTSKTQYTSSAISVNEPSTFYVKIAITITNGSSTTSNRDTQVDDIVISGESTSTSSLTSIACANQSVSVASSVNLANQIVFTPNDAADKTVSYAVKSGSANIDLDANGVVTGKKSGSGVVTITPNDTSGGAVAIDVTITVTAITVPDVTIGNQYSIYCLDSKNSSNGELSGVSSNLGTVETFSGSVPPSNTLWEAEEGYYENTIAFTNGSVYLSLTAASNNLHAESSVTKNASWIVDWDSSTEEVTITNAVYQNRQIQYNYNTGSPRFACYTGSQTAVQLHEVSGVSLTDFTIDASISVYKTGTATIGVTYTPADASDKTLSWSSDDTSIATVDSNGVVTGVAVGTTTVTAYKVIDEVNVERTCVVTVLNNKASHAGTASDPFNVSDAYNVAAGVIVQTSTGATIDLTNNYYYVKGMITKANTRTTSELTFWVGDNASQISTATGGFEIYKVAQVYSTALATYYTANTEVARDFGVGYTITASGKLTNYNGTLEMTTGGRVYYNSYIEARLFAEAFNTALEAVCDADGNTVAADLESAWSAQATAFAALDATLEQPILKNATAKTTSSATAVELCAAKYDYILGKYGTTTLSNFIDRTVSPSSANVRFAALANNNTALVVVVITAFVGVTFIGGYFFLRKKKEN